MGLEQVFQNVSSEEFLQARDWLEGLRDTEQERVAQTLKFLNDQHFCLDNAVGAETPVAVIVAGTSIDTTGYKDIDLFLLPESSLKDSDKKRADPKTVLRSHLVGKLPQLVFYMNYDTVILEESLLHVDTTLGAYVTVSLFHELKGFREQRADRNGDDLLAPKGIKGAEEIIEYNQKIGAKFLVLTRQYEVENKLPVYDNAPISALNERFSFDDFYSASELRAAVLEAFPLTPRATLSGLYQLGFGDTDGVVQNSTPREEYVTQRIPDVTTFSSSEDNPMQLVICESPRFKLSGDDGVYRNRTVFELTDCGYILIQSSFTDA